MGKSRSSGWDRNLHKLKNPYNRQGKGRFLQKPDTSSSDEYASSDMDDTYLVDREEEDQTSKDTEQQGNDQTSPIEEVKQKDDPTVVTRDGFLKHLREQNDSKQSSESPPKTSSKPSPKISSKPPFKTPSKPSFKPSSKPSFKPSSKPPSKPRSKNRYGNRRPRFSGQDRFNGGFQQDSGAFERPPLTNPNESNKNKDDTCRPISIFYIDKERGLTEKTTGKCADDDIMSLHRDPHKHNQMRQPPPKTQPRFDRNKSGNKKKDKTRPVPPIVDPKKANMPTTPNDRDVGNKAISHPDRSKQNDDIKEIPRSRSGFVPDPRTRRWNQWMPKAPSRFDKKRHKKGVNKKSRNPDNVVSDSKEMLSDKSTRVHSEESDRNDKNLSIDVNKSSEESGSDREVPAHKSFNPFNEEPSSDPDLTGLSSSENESEDDSPAETEAPSSEVHRPDFDQSPKDKSVSLVIVSEPDVSESNSSDADETSPKLQKIKGTVERYDVESEPSTDTLIQKPSIMPLISITGNKTVQPVVTKNPTPISIINPITELNPDKPVVDLNGSSASVNEIGPPQNETSKNDNPTIIIPPIAASNPTNITTDGNSSQDVLSNSNDPIVTIIPPTVTSANIPPFVTLPQNNTKLPNDSVTESKPFDIIGTDSESNVVSIPSQ